MLLFRRAPAALTAIPGFNRKENITTIINNYATW